MSHYYTVFDDTGDSSPLIYLYPSASTLQQNQALANGLSWELLELFYWLVVSSIVPKKQTVAKNGTNSDAPVNTIQAPIVYSQQQPQRGMLFHL